MIRFPANWLTWSHATLTLVLALAAGALLSALQGAEARETTAKWALQESQTKVATLSTQLTEATRRAEDLERSSHVVTTTTRLPSGEVRETKQVDTRVSDRQVETDSKQKVSQQTTQTTTKVAEVSETRSQPEQATWAVEAWRSGTLIPGYGATVGLRLGPTPAWVEAGWGQASGIQLGIRMEFH